MKTRVEREVRVSSVEHYQVLGLLPSAPRELVEEVYWHMTQQMRTEAYGLPSVERLSALNDAYDRITHDFGEEANAADANRGRRTKQPRRLFGRRDANKKVRARNHYELLHLLPGANDDVVRLAASVLVMHARSDKPRLAEIERARVVLTTPEQRAAYDRKMGLLRKRAKDARTDERSEGSSADGAKGSATAAVDDLGAFAEDATETDVHRPRRGFGLAGLFAKAEPTPEAIAAENDRVLTLADGDTVWDVAETDDVGSATAAEASGAARSSRAFTVTFMKGAREGEALILDGADELRLDLKAQTGDAQIRVWRRGGVYLLQQLFGPPVTIGSAYLEAPVVVLEDGDMIECGEHLLACRITAG